MTSSDGSTIGGCLPICSSSPTTAVLNNSCNGLDCCQTTIPFSLASFNTSFQKIEGNNNNNFEGEGEEQCKYAFLADQEWLSRTTRNISAIRGMNNVPVVLDWKLYYNSSLLRVLGLSIKTKKSEYDSYYDDSNSDYFLDKYGNYNGYTNSSCSSSFQLVLNRSTFECRCPRGYEGNPYLAKGCRDIDECVDGGYDRCGPNAYCSNYNGYYGCYLPFRKKSRLKQVLIGVGSGLGSLVLVSLAVWLYIVIRRRKIRKRKEKFFKRNGGLLLQQQLSSGEVNVEKTKLFNSKELEKATDKFNINRILGQGGQGTVYKGMLIDGKIVAVKKSKIIDQSKLTEFINEVVILSQINHRSVVKLLGCCLETEVPLLVYEYIPNGTLSQYIQDQNEEFPLTWEARIRIAAEVAGALSYLHSSASLPIFHRDIKSTNILLDEKYRAKVADFGTSRSVAIDQTHLTTIVHGTFGYLDPEYFQSSQFTDKSDVYSFGVVLVELLTGQKPISITRADEGRSLATYFMLSMEENRLFDIVDARVLKEAERQGIIAFATLAKRCLNLNGKRRPTMKEVANVLEDIQKSVKSSNGQQKFEVVEYLRDQVQPELWDVVTTSTRSGSYGGTGSISSDGVPLLSTK